MIRVRLETDEHGRIVRFRMKGHALDRWPFADPICAGVSAIAQTAIGSLQDIAGIEPTYTLNHGDIACAFTYPDDPEQALKAEVIMETVRIGCLQIEHSYGRDKVTVEMTSKE
ncbi:MAG: ribosomal-processing cysteine protease Prp [Saccharofermentanales bacterium]|jgi:uncharacterized protein YsxB (DUF464 family)